MFLCALLEVDGALTPSSHLIMDCLRAVHPLNGCCSER